MSHSAVVSTNKLHALSEGIRRKQVGDADILAVAAESCAKKRRGNPVHEMNENINPNKFDIGVHAKESTEVLPKLDAYNVTPHIPKLKSKKVVKTSSPLPKKVVTTSSEAASSTMIHTPVEIQNEFNDFNDLSFDTSRVNSRRRSSIGSIDTEATSCMTLTDLRDILMEHLLRIVNTGTFEELIALKNIGKARATEIMTDRNTGVVFESLYDLESIGMNEKTIKKFINNNLLQIIAV